MGNVKSSPVRLPSRLRLPMLAMPVLCAAVLGGVHQSRAAWRAGAARPLRLTWDENRAPGEMLRAGDAPVSTYQPAFAAAFAPNRAGQASGPGEWTLYFTRESNGARNIWRAVASGPAAALRDARATAGADGDDAAPEAARAPGSALRALSWHAAPVTHLVEPAFATEPAVSGDGRVLLCVTNVLGAPAAPVAANPGGRAAHTWIARWDLASNRWAALTPQDAHDHSPAIAPGAQRLAFVSDRAGLESIYVMPLPGGVARRVVSMARNPCWLDDTTLVFQSIRPGRVGLYRLTVPRDGEPGLADARPTLLFDRLGEAAAAPDGRLLCIAAEPGPSVPRRMDSGSDNGPAPARPAPLRQMYLLAPDGSSAHAVPGTDGARSPRFTPDGSAILFDVPLEVSGGSAPAPNAAAPQQGSATNATRTLWLLPLLHAPPHAALLKVQPVAGLSPASASPGAAAGEVQIIGTAFAEEPGATLARLEYGEGADPGQWHELGVRRLPVQQGVLGTWRVPPMAQGEWTVRLTVTDSSGDSAQTTLPISLPLAPLPAPGANPPIFPVHTLPSTTGPPTESSSALLRATPAPATTAPAAPTATAPAAAGTVGLPQPAPDRGNSGPPPTAPNAGSSGPTRIAGPVPALPLPALPPAPTPVPVAPGAAPGDHNPVVTAPGTAPATSPAGPVWVPRVAPQTGGPLPPAVRPRRRSKPRKVIKKVTKRTASAPGVHIPSAGHETARSSTRAAQTPARRPVHRILIGRAPAAAGPDAGRIIARGTPATMQVGQSADVVLTLTNTGSRAWLAESAQPVRLVCRWVDAATGMRSRWTIHWLHSDVRPGGSVELTVPLSAPPRPGRYHLSYVLVRLNGVKFAPPAATAATQRWPGEFADAGYRVIVR